MSRFALALAYVLGLAGTADAATAAAPEPRVALVIGNSTYREAPLANPANDAHLLAAALRGLGFEVIERTDLDQNAMKRAVVEFSDRLNRLGRDAVGLFFYAGHGLQVNGRNYLVPLGAEIKRESHVEIEAVSASWVLEEMELAGNRMNFVILDACRNNPLTRRFRSPARGLARMDAPQGSLVAYSTAPGAVARDGAGANSPYALALAREMQTPGVAVEQMFKQVRVTVMGETKDQQIPWESSSLTGSFYFNPAKPAAAPASDPATAAAPVTLSADTTAMDLTFWQSIKDSPDPEMFEEYLRQFPGGTFAGLAKLKRDTLRAAPTPVTRTAAVVPPPETGIGIDDLDAIFVALKTSNVRAEPTSESERIGRLARDALVAVTGKVTGRNWYRIDYQGRTAFVFGPRIREVDPGELAEWEKVSGSSERADFERYLERYPNGHFADRAKGRLAVLAPPKETIGIEEMDATFAVLKTSNVRAEPTSESERIGRLARDALVAVTGKVTGRNWYRIDYQGGTAFVFGTRIRRVDQSEFAAWESVAGSSQRADFERFLERYPDGYFTEQAKGRLAVLAPPPAPAPTPAQPVVGVYPKRPGETFKDCGACPDMVVIAAGAFTMGSPASEESRGGDEGPQHRVTIGQAFALGKYEVTFDEWAGCVADGGCGRHRPNDNGWGRGRRPVINVSWHDAKTYVGWLSRKTGKRYRLPSEAEWEYAARAGTTTPFHVGPTIGADQANFDASNTYGGGSRGVFRRQTVPVGSFPPNAFGIHDVHGNVWEWTEDCRHKSYAGAPADGGAWMTGGDCGKHITRGGSYSRPPKLIRSANRRGRPTGGRYKYLGFRVATTLAE